jgi:Zn-dependent protease
MQELNIIQIIAVAAIPVVFAITVHETAHGWAAKNLGDPTAMMLGRLTLNPLKHIDPIGTVVVPIILYMTTGFMFGWAKPVPVTWENLRKPKRDMALVAAAGPMSNLLMAVFWVLLLKLSVTWAGVLGGLTFFLVNMAKIGVVINLILMILNLIPVPPLDGGRVLSGLLPGPWAWRLSRIEPYGLIIMVVLMVTGLLGNLLIPPMNFLYGLLFSLVGLQ